MAKLALKFLSGKYQGGEFPVPESGSLMVGRGPELDIVLVEDMVSRKHARLEIEDGTITLIDLGSTNGTFVNGAKIDRARLELDDRILIGTSILRLSEAGGGDTADAADPMHARETMEEIAQRAPPASSAMAGELQEVPLPDLLQLFAVNRKSGVLTLEGARTGRIYLREGVIEAAEIEGAEDIAPSKAMCRLVDWHDGRFHFDPGAELRAGDPQFPGSTEGTLLEAVRQNDEARALRGQFPSDTCALRLVVPLRARLADLAEAELDVLQLAINLGRLDAVLDGSLASDQALLGSLHKLIRGGFLSAQ